nr:triphosphoribosyl-dephospho-CoA synthase [Paraburkholderia phosphatilytica]
MVQDDAASRLAPSASDTDLGRLAVAALIAEAELTPKPALVDRRGSGAHTDLDLDTMLRSARSLESTFVALARTSRGRSPSATLRAELGQIGRAGERAMLDATEGSNAHRGAIWIVGLLAAGAAICANTLPEETSESYASRICTTAAQIACFPDRFAAGSTAVSSAAVTHRPSNGERVRQRYGVGGARQEAQYAFPHVRRAGLPTLRAARTRGAAEDHARLDALLAIMVSLDDTCLLHRAGLPGLNTAQQGARRVLAAGGSATHEGRAEFDSLERALLLQNASPGGAADLLAATLFIDRLTSPGVSGSPITWNI